VGVVSACDASSGGERSGGPAGAVPVEGVERLPRAICDRLTPTLLRRIDHGAHRERSGEIQLVPPESLQAGGLSHASPFDTTQRVPLVLVGAGVRPGAYAEPVTLADVAPTVASVLEFDGFDAPDGRSLDEALMPPEEREPPRLVVTLIWDSAGTDLLRRWPDAWPRLRALAARGAWFTHAALDASPSNTPPSHATIGTGAFPSTHGIPDEYVRVGDGRIERPLHLGPRILRAPTLGDRYDLASGNRPLVGAVGSLSAHLLMMSRGSFVPGADRDLAITREPRDAATGGDDSAPRWQLSEEMAPYYRFPPYANDPAFAERFLREVDALDLADGADDGRWRDHEIAPLLGGWDTPARSAWQTDLIAGVIEREGFGADDVTDLLYVNYKMLDSLGHSYSADGVELADGLRAQDRELDRLVTTLDRLVGRDAWTMVLTADHGMARDPEVTGAERYDVSSLAATVEAAFGADGRVVEQMRPTQIWLDTAALERGGATVDDVAAFLMALTRDEVVAGDGPVARADEPAFLAAIPTAALGDLPCAGGTGAGGAA
jgi:hypothetical protein